MARRMGKRKHKGGRGKAMINSPMHSPFGGHMKGRKGKRAGGRRR